MADSEGVVPFAPAELPTIVSEQAPDFDVVRVVKRHNAIIENVGGRDGALRQVEFGEDVRTMRINDPLPIDLADAFDGADEVGVLAEQMSTVGGDSTWCSGSMV